MKSQSSKVFSGFINNIQNKCSWYKLNLGYIYTYIHTSKSHFIKYKPFFFKPDQKLLQVWQNDIRNKVSFSRYANSTNSFDTLNIHPYWPSHLLSFQTVASLFLSLGFMAYQHL